MSKWMKLKRQSKKRGGESWLIRFSAVEIWQLDTLALLGVLLEEEQFMPSWERDFVLQVALRVGIRALWDEAQARIEIEIAPQ
jgi:hypothetical protein